MELKKIIAKLPAGFIDDAAGMDGEQLRAEIIRAETALHEVDKELKADEKLSGAREIVKDMVGGYNDAKKAQRAKIAYALWLLEERGELGTGEDTSPKQKKGSATVAELKPGKKKAAGR